MREKAAKIGRFNIVDIVAVLLIAAAAVIVVWKLSGAGEAPVETKSVTMTYIVKADNVMRELYESSRATLPAKLMASGKLLDGEVQSVEMKPHYVLSGNGTWSEDPSRVDLYFTVVAHVTAEDVLLSKVGEQEVRIGRADHILKTEYIEFHSTAIVDVQWSE